MALSSKFILTGDGKATRSPKTLIAISTVVLFGGVDESRITNEVLPLIDLLPTVRTPAGVRVAVAMLASSEPGTMVYGPIPPEIVLVVAGSPI